MARVGDIARFLQQLAPPQLAEEWDNVGLLVGDRQRTVQRVMTCLTLTPDSAAEAVEEKADLVVTHHPLPFQPLKRITTDSPEGRLLWRLMGAQVSVYSPHTGFDSAAEGINRRLAEGLGLSDIGPLVPEEDDAAIGAGRFGTVAKGITLAGLARRAKRFLSIPRLQLVGDPQQKVRRIAVACGSAGEFLAPARRQRCDVLVTGETRFHTCLEAEAREVGLLLVGHYASERFALEHLAEALAEEFPRITVWASRRERDPLQWL